jgi:hypothetical protein
MHETDAAGAYAPAAHCKLAFAAGHLLPAGHLAQADEEAAVDIWPAIHCIGAERPGVGHCIPAGQGTHAVAPATGP